jgi:hypothetical protein
LINIVAPEVPAIKPPAAFSDNWVLRNSGLRIVQCDTRVGQADRDGDAKRDRIESGVIVDTIITPC